LDLTGLRPTFRILLQSQTHSGLECHN